MRTTNTKHLEQALRSAFEVCAEALQNVPRVGEPYDEQHRGTHLEACRQLRVAKEAAAGVPLVNARLLDTANLVQTALAFAPALGQAYEQRHSDVALAASLALQRLGLCGGHTARWDVGQDRDLADPQRELIGRLLDYAERYAQLCREPANGACWASIRRAEAWFETGSATIDPSDVQAELLEYVEKFADMNDEPADGDCREVLRLASAGSATVRPG